MSDIVRQFIVGDKKVLTGSDAHEFATRVQIVNMVEPLGNILLNAAIADQDSHTDTREVMKRIDQAFSPDN